MICKDLIVKRRMLFPEPGFWFGKQHPPDRLPFIFPFLLLKHPPLAGSFIIYNFTVLPVVAKAIVHLMFLLF